MKKVIALCSILFLIYCSDKPLNLEKTKSGDKKIKVYLLGTFHFAQMEKSYDILGKEKQDDIEKLVKIIAKHKPNKIFAERQPEYEFKMKIDSLFKVYQNMNRPLKAKNEIYQVGFRTAKLLGHSKVYLCDHPGRYGFHYQNSLKYAQENNQMGFLNGTAKGAIMREDDRVDEDSIVNNSSLIDYLKWLNSDIVMKTSHASYIANDIQVGSNNYYDFDDDDTLIGAELVADWYRRNIMIYSKIINQLDYEEDAIFLLIGADHIPTIKHLFESNPYFDVIPINKWLI